MEGLSKQTSPLYRYLYNGIEKNIDFGLNVYTAKYRTLDVTTGRWWQIDPMTEAFEGWSPYNSNLNNPIRYEDKEGDCPVCDVVLDIGFIIYDAVDIGVQYAKTGKVNPVSAAALSADVGVLFVPFVTGAGLAVRAGSEAVEQGAKRVDDLPSGGGKGSGDSGGGSSGKGGDNSKSDNNTGKGSEETKQIGPAGDPGGFITRQIPSDWIMKPANKGAGTRFIDTKNPKSNNVRVMQGNPDSPNPSQQTDYVKHTKNGTVVDKNGKPTKHDTPEAHIPKKEFKFNQD